MTGERADYSVMDEGTLWLLWPLSDAAVSWVKEHLPADSQTWGHAVVIEARYMPAILDGLAADGLVGRRRGRKVAA